MQNIIKQNTKIPTSCQVLELSSVFDTSKEEIQQGYCRRQITKENNAIVMSPQDPNNEIGLLREDDLNTLLGCFLMLKHSKKKVPTPSQQQNIKY